MIQNSYAFICRWVTNSEITLIGNVKYSLLLLLLGDSLAVLISLNDWDSGKTWPFHALRSLKNIQTDQEKLVIQCIHSYSDDSSLFFFSVMEFNPDGEEIKAA